MRLPTAPNPPDWCRALPKVELHAHLSGSVSYDTIRKLVNQPSKHNVREEALALIDPNADKSLQQWFQLFTVIHQLITDEESLRMITSQVLEDFARDNTVYLELRTTPRKCETLSSEDYLLTVLRTIEEFHHAHPDGMVCRLLISISRHLPVSDASETLSLLQGLLKSDNERLRGLIVGIELSGNPHKGQWSDFEPILEHARTKLGMPVSLHFGEVDNEKECLEMLDFKPDRIGHAVVLSEKVVQRLITQRPKIGVEVCLTSNLLTNAVETVEKHPVVTKLIPHCHPFCICTDDPGIFNTSLSDEYGRLLEGSDLTQNEVMKIALNGIDMAFCRDYKIMHRVRENAHSMVQRIRA